MRLTLFYKVLLVNILMIFLSFIMPIAGNIHVELILVPATFLFGTIYGFEILIVLGNFSELKKLLAAETGGLVYMYHIAQGIDGNFAKDIEERIERFVMTSIDYSLKYHISSTDKDFLSIAEPLKNIQVKTPKEEVAYESINRGFEKVVDARYQLGQVAPREVGLPEWIMLVLLAAILVLTLFLGREADLISRISSAIFAATVLGTLFLLDEADSNHIQETRLEYEIFNQVLEDIGKKHYYPQFALKNNLVKPKKKPYRVGTFPEFPDLSKREMQTIEA